MSCLVHLIVASIIFLLILIFFVCSTCRRLAKINQARQIYLTIGRVATLSKQDVRYLGAIAHFLNTKAEGGIDVEQTSVAETH